LGLGLGRRKLLSEGSLGFAGETAWRGRLIGSCGAFAVVLLFGAIVETGGAGVGRGRAAVAGGEDEFGEGGVGAFAEEHVATGAVEQGGEDGGRLGRAVVTEDALIGDAAADGHAGEAGDLAEDLVEAGVVGADVKQAGSVGDGGAVGEILFGGGLVGGGGGDG